MTAPIPDLDRTVNFTIPGRHARGRVARLGPVLNQILSAHAYPPPIERVMAEALTLTALLGSTLKEAGGQLTLQAQTPKESGGGIVSLLVCDYRAGAVRGYADFDAERLAKLGANPSLAALFGEGYLAITFETEGRQRYQGIVPLEGDSLAAACEAYFTQSEQIPTLIRVASRSAAGHRTAAGLLIQHLPDGEEGRERLSVQMDHPEWEHVHALASTTKAEELADAGLSLEALIWRLFHEESEIRVEVLPPLSRGCRCTSEYYLSVLSRFPEGEREHMRGDDGLVTVDCAFCSREFKIAV